MIYCLLTNILFVFVYIYFYQTPTLTFAQNVLSEGVTVYYPFTNALLVTLTAWILQAVVRSVTKLRGIGYALTFVPSMLFVAFLTSIEVEGDHDFRVTTWVWLIPLILLLFFFLAHYVRQIEIVSGKTVKSHVSESINMFVSLVMMLLVSIAGNGDEMLHKRIKAEKLILKSEYKAIAENEHEGGEVLRFFGLASGDKSKKRCEKTDSTLSLIRFIALDKEGLLPEKLFTQPFLGNSMSLRQMENIKPYLFDKKFLSRRKSQDYYLCCLLADRDLDAFAKELTKTVNVDDSLACDSLPRHYREALVLYQHVRSKHITNYKDATLEVDYRDMRKLLEEKRDRREIAFEMKKVYGNTYWYYFQEKE